MHPFRAFIKKITYLAKQKYHDKLDVNPSEIKKSETVPNSVLTKKEVRERAVLEIYERTELKSLGYKRTKGSIYFVSNNYKLSINFSSAISPNRLEKVNILSVSASVGHEGFRKYNKEKHKINNGVFGGALIENLPVVHLYNFKKSCSF